MDSVILSLTAWYSTLLFIGEIFEHSIVEFFAFVDFFSFSFFVASQYFLSLPSSHFFFAPLLFCLSLPLHDIVISLSAVGVFALPQLHSW